MADKRATPQPSQTLSPLDSRGVNSPFVERVSSDADLLRAINGETEGEGGNPNNRGDGGSGSRAPQAGSPPGDRELSITPALPYANPFTASSNILETIAARFNQARESNRAGAWRQFQRDMMDAMPFICPHLIPLKDLISVVADIEKEIKGTSSSQTGKSNEELLADFLSGGPYLGSIPSSPAPKELDTPAMMANGDGAPPS